MSRKRQIVSLHDQQNRPSTSKELAIQDPIQKMPIKVSILEIEQFDKNPRKHSNEAFEEIKESIQKRGLDQPFTITRRPGEPKYMIKAGGNTRLMALHQLYQETKEERFLKVDTIFEPYTSETDALISHLTENDLRGNLILIDRAQGIRDTQLALEDECNMKLSLRELESALKEQGYTVGRTVISVLFYALDHLYPHIPKALDSGMGKSQIERIRKFENQCREAWKNMEMNIGQFEEAFHHALAKTDSEESFDFEMLLNEFEEATCDLTGEQLNTVRFYLEQVMRKRIIPANEKHIIQEENSEKNETNEPVPILDTNSNLDADESSFNIEDETPAKEVTTQSEATSNQINEATEENALPFVDNEFDEDEFSDATEVNEEPDYTVQDLREITLKTVLKLAEDANIEDLIIPIQNGYGWFLADVPQHIHFPNGFVEDDKAFRSIWRTWYTLFTLCGATTESRAIAANHIHQQNDLKHILNEEFDLLSGIGAYVSTAGVSNDFWDVATDDIVETAIEIVTLHRKIKRLANAVNLTLWQEV